MLTKHKDKLLPLLRDILLLTVGATIYAIGVSMFLDSNDMASGGVTGLSIILNRLFVNMGLDFLQTGTLVLIINIPLLILSAWRFHLKFALSTIYATALSSAVMDLVAPIHARELFRITEGLRINVPVTENMILAAIFGGAVAAVGMGFVFHGGGSTGGTDIVAKFLRQKYNHIRTGSIFFVMDLVVVVASSFLFGIESALYSAVCILVSSYVLDLMLYGKDGANLVYIISVDPEAVSHRLLTEGNVGITLLKGKGGYTGDGREILLCAFHKQLYPRVRKMVKETDPKAFMIVTRANEVFGEGFKNPFADEM